MMKYFHAIALGAVEGLTEFLPVSSTGHLILFSKILGLEQNSDFLKLFEIVIQSGAILAIIGIYLKEFIRRKKWLLDLLIAFLPSGILGLLFYKWIKLHLFTPQVVCTSLVIGGFILIALEFKTNPSSDLKKFEETSLSYTRLLGVGLFQCLAFIPGVSRSAATIIGAELLGLSRANAVKLSFLLGVPTILSASVYSLLKHPQSITLDQWNVLALGFLFSFAGALLSVKIFLRFLEKKAFLICGIYRVIVGIVYAYFFL